MYSNYTNYGFLGKRRTSKY